MFRFPWSKKANTSVPATNGKEPAPNLPGFAASADPASTLTDEMIANRPYDVIPTTTSLSWEIGSLILDQYRVVGFLGQGGYARVFLIRDVVSGEPFAVKVTKNVGEHRRRQVLEEAQSLIDLPRYPYLVPLHFIRYIGDELLLFSEYVEGGTLAQWMAKHPQPDFKSRLAASIHMALGLCVLHEGCMVHCDIKPSNILMDHDGTARISDFGLARNILSSILPEVMQIGELDATSFKGSRPYRSPAHVGSGSVPHRRMDIWCLGTTLLHLFLGERPWDDGLQAPQWVDALQGEEHSEVKKILQACFSGAQNIQTISNCLRDEYGKRFGLLQIVEPQAGPNQQLTEWIGRMGTETVLAQKYAQGRRRRGHGVDVWMELMGDGEGAGNLSDEMAMAFLVGRGSDLLIEKAFARVEALGRERHSEKSLLATLLFNRAEGLAKLNNLPAALDRLQEAFSLVAGNSELAAVSLAASILLLRFKVLNSLGKDGIDDLRQVVRLLSQREADADEAALWDLAEAHGILGCNQGDGTALDTLVHLETAVRILQPWTDREAFHRKRSALIAMMNVHFGQGDNRRGLEILQRLVETYEQAVFEWGLRDLLPELKSWAQDLGTLRHQLGEGSLLDRTRMVHICARAAAAGIEEINLLLLKGSLVVIYDLMEARRYEAVISACRAILPLMAYKTEKEPSLLRIQIMGCQAKAFYFQGEFEQCLSIHLAALEFMRASPEAANAIPMQHYFVAEALASLGRGQEAIAFATRGLELAEDPDSARFLREGLASYSV